jgi:hypothetical protein
LLNPFKVYRTLDQQHISAINQEASYVLFAKNEKYKSWMEGSVAHEI